MNKVLRPYLLRVYLYALAFLLQVTGRAVDRAWLTYLGFGLLVIALLWTALTWQQYKRTVRRLERGDFG